MAVDVREEAVGILGGRRLWLADEPSDEAAVKATFEELEDEFDPAGGGPIGLCLAITDAEEMERRPQAVWPQSGMMHAGFLDDGTQIRVRYFEDACIEPGPPEAPTQEQSRNTDYSLEGSDYAAAAFAESHVTEDDVLALWRREARIPEQEALRRVHEVINVVTTEDEGLVALSTAFPKWNAQLRMSIWYFRTLVAEAHRATHVGTHLTLRNRDMLEGRYVSGEDTRGAGVAFELENSALRRYFNRAIWDQVMFFYIGDNERGDPVRVHYFPGATISQR